jgi:hypothetical protein
MQHGVEELRKHIVASLRGVIAVLEEDVKLVESSKSAEEIVAVVRALADYLRTFSQRIEEYIATRSKARS